MKKLYWIMINPQYLDYLKKFEERIPNYDYGKDHIKPFYGILFEKDDLCYVTTINHFKDKHLSMHATIDFQKIYDYQYGKPIATANLNYMFPVPKDQFHRLDYREIDDYVDFKNSRARYNQVTLMKKILLGLNHSNMQRRAISIYEHKYNHADTVLARRCFDFKELEKHALNYNIDRNIDHEEYDITETSDEITNEITLDPNHGIQF